MQLQASWRGRTLSALIKESKAAQFAPNSAHNFNQVIEPDLEKIKFESEFASSVLSFRG